jgi:hypothetical protein
MIITSTVRLIWPNHPGFVLEVGRNDVAEADIPLAVHGKLAHYAKSRVIRGYEPSHEFVARATEARPARPVVATLNTLKAGVPVR